MATYSTDKTDAQQQQQSQSSVTQNFRYYIDVVGKKSRSGFDKVHCQLLSFFGKKEKESKASIARRLGGQSVFYQNDGVDCDADMQCDQATESYSKPNPPIIKPQNVMPIPIYPPSATVSACRRNVECDPMWQTTERTIAGCKADAEEKETECDYLSSEDEDRIYTEIDGNADVNNDGEDYVDMSAVQNRNCCPPPCAGASEHDYVNTPDKICTDSNLPKGSDGHANFKLTIPEKGPDYENAPAKMPRSAKTICFKSKLAPSSPASTSPDKSQSASNVTTAGFQTNEKLPPYTMRTEIRTSQDNNFFSFNVFEVAKCLEACGMQTFAEICRTELLDGSFFKDFENIPWDKEPFKMSEFHVAKIRKIINGWRPVKKPTIKKRSTKAYCTKSRLNNP